MTHPPAQPRRPLRRATRGAAHADCRAPPVTPSSPTAPSRRTVAIVLAAGLGTRMKSRVPKVLHALCGRPMLEYVLDAADGRHRARGRSSSTRRRPRRSATPSRGAPTRPSRTSRAGPVTPSAPRSRRCPRRRRGGPRPVRRRPARARPTSSRRCSRPARWTTPRWRWSPWTRSTRRAWAVSSATRAARWSGSSRTRTPPTRSARSPRSTPACTRSTPPGSGAGSATCEPIADDRRAVPHRPRRGSPARTAGWWPRSRSTTTGGSPASTTAPSSPAPSGTCGSSSTTAGCRPGVTMVDPSTVYLDHGVELAEDVILEPNVVLRGATTDRRADPDRERARQVHRHARSAPDCVIWASVIERVDRRGRRHDRPVQPPPARRPRGQPLARSATTPRSRTAASATHVRQHHMSYLGDADVGADTNVGRGHDHRQLRRRRQAPHDDRRGRVPGRRHDAPRAGHAGRRVADRRRRGRHEGRPAGQARGRRAGPHPRDPRLRPATRHPTGQRTPRPNPQPRATAPDGRHPHRARDHRPAGPPQRRVRRRRDRPRVAPPEPRRAAGRRGPPRRAARPAPDRATPAASSRSSSSAITFIGFLASAFAGVSLATGLADAAGRRSA